MVYTAQSQSLAALEILVHTDDPSDLAALDYVVIPVEIPEGSIRSVPKLPPRWWIYPATPATARLGDRWIKSNLSPVLRVPSAIVRDEWSYLINPNHPSVAKFHVGKPKPFVFDSRLGPERSRAKSRSAGK